MIKGTHITAVGADAPGKQEVFALVLAKADRVVADSLAQCLRFGEIHHAVETGVLKPEDVYGELGELAAGSKPGRGATGRDHGGRPDGRGHPGRGGGGLRGRGSRAHRPGAGDRGLTPALTKGHNRKTCWARRSPTFA